MRIMALDACPVIVQVILAASWDNSDFNSFSCKGQIQRFLIVSQGNLVGDDFVHLDLSALQIVERSGETVDLSEGTLDRQFTPHDVSGRYLGNRLVGINGIDHDGAVASGETDRILQQVCGTGSLDDVVESIGADI